MLDIGIDFGSTYTMVSVYRRGLKIPETVPLSEGESPMIPTAYACKSDGSKALIGWTAKENTAPYMRKFRAFKMMLPEDDGERLRARNFDEKFSPEEITKRYITELLTKVLQREGETKIGNLVVGAPEVWYDAFATIDGRTKLRNICRSLPFFEEGQEDAVRIVSEPAAASAFFAYNYRQIRKETFDGHILLIDYGGGTLDISLTEIHPSGGEDFEIRVLNHAGAGENEQKGEIGRAGIIYMETLTRTAILESCPDLTQVPGDDDFFETVNAVERALMGNTHLIDEVFLEYGTDPEDLDEDRMEEEFYFTKVYYRGQRVLLTYRQLAEVYDQVIRPVFHEKMQEFIRYMDAEGIAWNNRTNDKFKIVLVGGFGNFALVKAQMRECFGISHTDRRQKDTLMSAADCEKAISMGCSLLAAGAVHLRNTAPIGIGVLTVPLGGVGKKYNLSYGLKYHQDITFGKEYIQKRKENAGPEFIHLSVLDRFLVDTGKGPLPLAPKPEFRAMLREASERSFLAYVGFSLDPSGVITLYIHDYDYLTQRETDCVTLELANYKSLFDTQSIDEKELEMIRNSLRK